MTLEEACALIAELEAERDRLTTALVEASKDIAGVRAELNRVLVDLTHEVGFREEAAARIAELEAERDGYHATNENLILDLNRVRTGREEMKDRIAELEAEAAGWSRELTTAYARIAELDAEVERLHKLVHDIIEDDEATTRIAELEAEVARLTAALAGAADALKPFALEADNYDPLEGDDDRDTRSVFTMGQLRHARTEVAYLYRLIAELEAENKRLLDTCKAWEEQYWEAQDKYDPFPNELFGETK